MSRIINFYYGKAKTARGFTIDQVWEFDDDRLERYHDYINWLFALDEPSQYDKNSPVLTMEDIKEFRDSDLLQKHVIKSLELMLKFYGFEHGYVSPPIKAKIERWVSPDNHNFLRITRILKFLNLIGKQYEAIKFLHALLGIYQMYPNTIGNDVIYWCQAIGYQYQQGK